MSPTELSRRFFFAFIFICLLAGGPLSRGQTYRSDGPDDPPESESAPAGHKDAKHAELSDIFLKPDFWRAGPAEIPAMLEHTFGQGLLKTEFVSYPVAHKTAATFLGQTVREGVIRLAGGRPKNLYVVLSYTEKHDALDEIKKSFSDAERGLREKLQSEGERHSFTFRNKRVIRIIEWKNSVVRVQLRGGEAAPGAFVSVLVENPAAPDLGMERRLSVKKDWLETNEAEAVSSGENYKLLAVPMRKQLAGIGSCWSTTIARQMSYMGSEIEPQMVETMTAGGEDKEMEAEDRGLGVRRLTYHIQSRNQASETCLHLLKTYNDAADRKGAEKIKYTDKDDKIVFADNFINMKNEFVPPVSRDHEAKYKLFRGIIISAVRHNMPVGWTVIRWAPKNCHGGSKHRRMIIGFDLEKDIVHLSDSWGFPFENRTMPFRAAFAMTVWMQILAPEWVPASNFPPENK
jgi:hypothetical protein